MCVCVCFTHDVKDFQDFDLKAFNVVLSLLRSGLTKTRTMVEQFRGGLVRKAHRRLYHSTPGSRVIEKKSDKGA